MKWILLFLTISVLLHACGNAPPPPMPKKFQPVVNPNPNYFMTVKGHVAPELAGTVRLVWVTEYYTANPECEVVTNQFEGVRNAREVENTLIVKPNSSGNYEYKIPLDKYLPGFCRWQVSDSSYILSSKNNTLFKNQVNYINKSISNNKIEGIKPVIAREVHDYLSCSDNEKIFQCKYFKNVPDNPYDGFSDQQNNIYQINVGVANDHNN